MKYLPIAAASACVIALAIAGLKRRAMWWRPGKKS